MSVAGELPEGRYGRSADARADRTLKIVGAVLAAGMIALIGWFGYSHVVAKDLSAEMIKFKVVSDTEVQVHLEVRKDAGASGVCTLSSQDEQHREVGRKDVRFDQRADRVDEIVKLRTTGRANMVELVGCQSGTGR
ncbi:DUF4307 domain-containing protein [Streptomyces sp. NPDC051219]|uniref:DUF4307 domain-containing protein n=1 Tax=Streptomyces sp. NPDC051219 TaxID=3155283 RepID=UPI00343755E8